MSSEMTLLVKLAADAKGLTKGFETAKKTLDEFKKETEKGFSNMGDRLTSYGKTLTASVTAPIVALGGAAVKSFNTLDEAEDIIIQKTGATGDTLKELNDVTKNLFTDLPMDADKVAEAVGEVNTRFEVTGPLCEEISKQFLEFAELNGGEVSDSIDQVQNALSAYGLGAEDVGHVLDVMNYVGQQTGVSMETLSGGVIQNAAAFQELGLNMDESLYFMGQLEKSGANSDTVMQGLRKALKNSAEEGKDFKTTLSELQDAILNGTDGIDGLSYAYDIFGRNGDQIYNAIKNGTLNLNDFAFAAEDAEGSVSNTFEATQDPADQFEVLMHNLTTVMGELGGELMETVGPAIESVTDGIKGFTDWFRDLPDGVKQGIVIIGGIIAAIGPLLMIIGGLAGSIGNIIALGSVLLPIITSVGPIILIVIAVIAAIIAIVKNWGAISEWFGKVWEALKQAIKNGIDALKEHIGKFVEGVKKFLEDVWNSVSNVFKTIYDTISDIISGIWDFIKDIIDTAIDKVKTIIDVVSSILQEIWGVVQNVFKAIGDFIQGIFDGIQNAWDGLGQFVSGVFDGISYAIEWLVDVVKGFVNDVISGINWALDLINKIPGVSIGYIPYLARGTDNFSGGFAVINERGGELVNLPDGSQVIPHDISEKYAQEAARNSGKGVEIDMEGLFEGLILRLDNFINVDGRPIYQGAAEYTIRQISNDIKAERRLRGLAT